MAKWDKQYAQLTEKGDIVRILGFTTLKHMKDEEARDQLVDNLEKVVDMQIDVERRNAVKQYDKGLNVGIWLGGAAAMVGVVIVELIDRYVVNKV